jgi:hypothetical protein
MGEKVLMLNYDLLCGSLQALIRFKLQKDGGCIFAAVRSGPGKRGSFPAWFPFSCFLPPAFLESSCG